MKRLLPLLLLVLLLLMSACQQTDTPSPSPSSSPSVSPTPSSGGDADATTPILKVGNFTADSIDMDYYYYATISGFVSYYGDSLTGVLDLSQPFSEQTVPERDITWDQYFQEAAIQDLVSCLLLGNAATEAGTVLTAEDETMYEDFLSYVDSSRGVDESMDEFLQVEYGPNMTVARLSDILRQQLLGRRFEIEKQDSYTYTEQELRDYFDAHNDGTVSEADTVNVRHILVGTEEEAQALLIQWEAGAKTEDSFAALVAGNTLDTYSEDIGGLYENVYVGQMVAPFEEWCFDAARKTGDTGIVGTDYGFHVMYFISPSTPYWKIWAEEAIRAEEYNDFYATLETLYPVEWLD